MKRETVTITDNSTGRSVECPIYRGIYGPPVIGTQILYKELGMFTLDPGFLTTASCRSAITYLDGDEGTLLHRGYPIDQLAEHSTFLEMCYLLIYGELPSQPQMDEFETAIKRHSMVHEHLIKFYGGYRYDAHPMAMMVGVMGAMASYYHDAMNIFDPEEQDMTARRI
ncbi:MAG TPA: citrate/2-methylcitrate synthase, partial [Gammaproteobacteria bacterium]|nr:citrate/2-methylcitrate synthase [Gammaproteobacteria bacterium]